QKTLAAPAFTVETPPTANTNLVITAKANPVLINEDIGFLRGNNDTEKIGALVKLFEGNDLKSENLINFTIIVNETNNTVILTAVRGYTISGQPSLTSNPYIINITPTVTNLQISPKAPARLTGPQIVNLTSTNPKNKLDALKLLFEGADLIESNLINFTVNVSGLPSNTVTLKGKDNFTINSQPEIKTTYTVGDNEELFISSQASSGAIKITQEELNALTKPTQSNISVQLTALQKLFKGINNLNQTYVTFKVDTFNKTVDLRPKQGFAFQSSNGIISVSFEVVN
ncbi:MAG: hypothetical protein ACRDAW_00830, partial [Metamycoplasmataceae bacterium]